ncbi:aminotransferase class I/II-fold pyridoxal phosphate-dependent enzyme [Amaricoccus sp.]|uniref:aminotransferase class I/II-fold pyridoxal phosphate-dependent enzyme n=1 Tax=Amaricoccus sp. TaxID=1872485 RepID=UPI001B533E4D|nr:aminotransferase class I/II-fold pyridoxal phosphate-dependent enzyme [Amaricoccus sp.]MBP7242734.1 aminotransferase class I/II-fold pyridoxal phosphate-dependent enzyme [Amaricoccus sp.]
MQLPERFSSLPEYAFPRLRRLLADVPPGGPELALSLGEPKHAPPAFVGEIIAAHAAEFGRYPPNEGVDELRQAISDWLARRYGVSVDPDREIVALNGSREGLFRAALALSPELKHGQRPAILVPNPFYQAYGAGALAAGADLVPVPATAETGFLPDYARLPAALLDRVSLAFVCSPANPQGAVASAEDWRRLIALAERHDFVLCADECYSEIWRETPPPGALAAARAAGADPERVAIFQSLSKRSSAPGLRCGFAAGGPRAIASLLRLTAYGGAPVPLPLQRAAAALWRDEAHVEASRLRYKAKFDAADRILGGMPGYASPPAGFFLWLDVGDGEAAAVRLWREAGVRVLPGGYLGRATDGGPNPGAGYIRVALVAPHDDTIRGLEAIRAVLAPHAEERV